MIPELEVYYDFSKKPLPEVLSWLEEMGISPIRRSSLEAPQEWLERYGCCFPWVAIEGRIQLKAGFKRSQLERLLRRWRGMPLLGITTAIHSFPEKIASFFSRVAPESAKDLRQALAIYQANSLSNINASKTILFDSKDLKMPPNSKENESIAIAEVFTRSLRNWEFELTAQRGFREECGDYFLTGFRSGHSPILLTLCNSPWLTPELIESALDKLRNVDVVIGPTQTGGHYLLGLRSWHKALFEDDSVGNSTETIAQWKARAESLNLSIYELPLLQSIECREDLDRFATAIGEQVSGAEGESDNWKRSLLETCERVLVHSQDAFDSAVDRGVSS